MVDDEFLPGNGTFFRMHDPRAVERRRMSETSNPATNRTHHPRFLTGLPVERVTFTEQRIQNVEDVICQSIQNRDCKWKNARNDQLHTRNGKLVEIRTENATLRSQIADVLNKIAKIRSNPVY